MNEFDTLPKERLDKEETQRRLTIELSRTVSRFITTYQVSPIDILGALEVIKQTTWATHCAGVRKDS